MTIYHSIEVPPTLPGTERDIGFLGPARRDARQSITGSVVVRPEHSRRARLVCASGIRSTRNGGGYDYAIWEVLEPVPDGVTHLPLSYDLNSIRWVGSGTWAYRARYTGRTGISVFMTPVQFPEVEVFSGRMRPVQGWSGTMVLTDRGELAGLVALGDPRGYVYLTIPRWWTCHQRR